MFWYPLIYHQHTIFDPLIVSYFKLYHWSIPYLTEDDSSMSQKNSCCQLDYANLKWLCYKFALISFNVSWRNNFIFFALALVIRFITKLQFPPQKSMWIYILLASDSLCLSCPGCFLANSLITSGVLNASLIAAWIAYNQRMQQFNLNQVQMIQSTSQLDINSLSRILIFLTRLLIKCTNSP